MERVIDDQERLDDFERWRASGRDYAVSVNGAADAQPRFTGRDPDGLEHDLGTKLDDHVEWLDLEPHQVRAIDHELLERAATEAVWVPVGETTTASLSELDGKEIEQVINVGPDPAPEIVQPVERFSDNPMVAKNMRGQVADLTQAQASLQEAVAERSSTSLDAFGVGHSSYGMSVRPDHPEPGVDPHRQQ